MLVPSVMTSTTRQSEPFRRSLQMRMSQRVRPWVTRANNCATFVDREVTLDRRLH